MSRKRRVFDLHLPDDEPAGEAAAPASPAPSGPPQGAPRRGPMAAAIGETGDALRDRAATLAAIRDENDALAHEHVRLRDLGLVVEAVPLEAVSTYKLVRDRRNGPLAHEGLDELVTSIREVGLSNPIRVERAGDRFELIQGFRRLAAYRQLAEEDGDAWAAIPALVFPAGESLDTLYRRMVDENMVRKDISFAEMAQLALNYTAATGGEMTPEKAVAVLFRSAGYQKRSYIRGFIPLVERLEGVLRFPEEIPRALGLRLAERIAEDYATVTRIKAALKDWDNRSVPDELEVLRREAEPPQPTGTADEPGTARAPSPAPSRPKREPAPQVTFRMKHPLRRGEVVCTATEGRLELHLPLDPTRTRQGEIESAVRALLEKLG